MLAPCEDVTMTLRERARRLSAFVQDRAGDFYQGALIYSESDYELIDTDPAVRAQYSDDDITAIIALLRDHHEADVRNRPDEIPAGNLQTSIYVLEAAIVMHYMVSQTRGAAIALDPEAGRDLFRFISETRSYLEQ